MGYPVSKSVSHIGTSPKWIIVRSTKFVAISRGSSHWRSILSTEKSAPSASGNSTAFKRSCIPFEDFELNRSRTTHINQDNRELNKILRMPHSHVPARPCFVCIRSSTEVVCGRDPRQAETIDELGGLD